MSGFALGTKIRMRAFFKDEDGTLADPSTITATMIPPDASGDIVFTYLSDSELTKDGTGAYVLRYTPTMAGPWYLRWKGDGAVEAASTDILVPVQATKATNP